MRALDRKLLRDLRHSRGQAIAIALVVAAGVAMFVSSLSTLRSLRASQEAFYDRYRFADVFANLKRAPESPDALVRCIAAAAGTPRASGGQ